MALDKTKKSLGELIAPLAQELHDMIYDYTFAAPEDPVTITKKYQLPSIAQVSRATRKKYLEDYYKNTFFGTASNIDKWIASLSDEHRAMLTDVRASHDPDADEEEEKEAGKRLLEKDCITWISSICWSIDEIPKLK